MSLTSILSSQPPAGESRARRLSSASSPRSPAVRQQPAVAEVNAFVDWLAALPLNAWLEIGRSIASDRSRIASRGIAWEQLQDTIAEHELQVAAWLVRDAVETAAFLAGHSLRRWSPEERRMFAAAHGAAETAALAMLSCSFLGMEQLTMLCEPAFDRFVSSHHRPVASSGDLSLI